MQCDALVRRTHKESFQESALACKQLGTPHTHIHARETKNNQNELHHHAFQHDDDGRAVPRGKLTSSPPRSRKAPTPARAAQTTAKSMAMRVAVSVALYATVILGAVVPATRKYLQRDMTRWSRMDARVGQALTSTAEVRALLAQTLMT